jgi:ubiquinone/menaquinone biosynthesis C-methylase UbiE
LPREVDLKSNETSTRTEDVEQVELFKTESWNYFQRNYAGKNLKELPLDVFCERLLQLYPIEIPGGSILDVGCGPGSNLYHLTRRLKAQRGVGIEPSKKVVAEMARAYPELEFYDHSAHALPFKTGEFDIVLFRSVLHWVDRNYLLQTLGEALRVTARYLLISDFAPFHPYSAVYHHQPEYKTFKTSYDSLIESTGFMQRLASLNSNEADDWKSVRTSLFLKVPFSKAFPIHAEADFRSS